MESLVLTVALFCSPIGMRAWLQRLATKVLIEYSATDLIHHHLCDVLAYRLSNQIATALPIYFRFLLPADTVYPDLEYPVP